MTASSPSETQDTTTRLWSDDPSAEDLLAFNALAQTLIDPLLDSDLDPVALGLSGPWGSGKSTILGLIETGLAAQTTDEKKILVVSTQPWRYDPTTGAKETLIGEVLAALEGELKLVADPATKTLDLAKRLAKRIEWAKAIKIAARVGITMQLPSVEDLVDLVKPKNATSSEDDRSLEAFRTEFEELMASDELAHLRAVVVLVDDLDRCLPRTVVESLEAMRLFLAVPKMSFVVAADEDRVADALRSEFPTNNSGDDAEGFEEPARLYLHKILQTTLPIPTLSRFDTQAYIVLLQVLAGHTPEDLIRLTGVCDALRTSGGALSDLETADAEAFADEIAFAARLTPLLYEKMQGNPRRIKRFLNDLSVRRSVAQRRGIELDAAVVAKLMVLEVMFRDEFKIVLDWLARGELRSQLSSLETAADRPEMKAATAPAADAAAKPERSVAKGKPKAADAPLSADADNPPKFSDALLRWAKLPPSLHTLDLAPYLYLAASFKAQPMLDGGLPERLKDLAANMLSSTRRGREAVTPADLAALQKRDVELLADYFGRLVRDQPSQQQIGVTALLRVARTCDGGVDAAVKGLSMIPANDVRFGTPLLVTAEDADEIFAVLQSWSSRTDSTQVRASIAEVVAGKDARGNK